ncbi:predicted protein [Naegleria gruberi]|uniref:Predicted protein n=1 Tax=Naegleria gruberi TaxID=5762 RepID=D2W3N7_NAEGR|nr:uncharacterized protein NAEGRDRAFT_76010 [Naegleria gruberi]EFC36272.1 predicted protein [Naegleria gruberi]|eukprot:XP_002669016.1 predicted protein [Naegleria gruberi strain NEG-M]
MKLALFLISLALCVLSVSCAFRTQYMYQGTGCPSEAFYVSTRDLTTTCNATTCAPYNNEENVLSIKWECPTGFPTPVSKSGEIYISTFDDASCSATSKNRYEVYKTNVCIKSSVIFGPSYNSGKYIGCEKFILYTDDACKTEGSTNSLTMNTCGTDKKIYKCGSASGLSVSMMVMLLVAILGMFSF